MPGSGSARGRRSDLPTRLASRPPASAGGTRPRFGLLKERVEWRKMIQRELIPFFQRVRDPEHVRQCFDLVRDLSTERPRPDARQRVHDLKEARRLSPEMLGPQFVTSLKESTARALLESSKLLKARLLKGGIDLWRKEAKELLDHRTLKQAGIQINPVPVGRATQSASQAYAIMLKTYTGPHLYIVVHLPKDYPSNQQSGATFKVVCAAVGDKRGERVEQIMRDVLPKSTTVVRVRDVVQAYVRALHQYKENIS